MQLIFLCNLQKLGATWVCITSSSNNSKSTYEKHSSLARTDHWNSKLSANIQCKKNNHSAFIMFQKICQNINEKTKLLAYLGPLKANHSWFMRLLTDSNNCFFICLVPYILICLYYFLILFFYFHLHFPSLLATRHILQFTMFDSISFQPARNITEIRNGS